ncbi:hypothetical protein H5154_00980 [Pseudoalteromonas sp. SR44-5]|uniref:hypothetical protein n=1 Tax=Pseudoalteromonas sp. SR44-5 TaxID=2760934 RepID=UPI0016015B0D|nr:hypothetical protein [Pseudoalteromonas sp. SR44-5]MBB1364971.1 hypothetical protein [Pseudoalteromonas sp. SR44-5]
MEKIQKFILISTVIGMVLSLLYLFGFWQAFNINILNYITLADVLKYGLYPISTFVVLVLLIYVPLVIIEGAFPHKEDENSPEIDYRKIRVWSGLLLVFFVILVALFINGCIKFMTITMLLPFGVTLILMNLPLFKKNFPYALYRFCIISISLVLVFNSFPMGNNVAEIRKNKNQQLKIDGEISKYTYIDVTDKYLFLWNKETNSVKVMKLENISSFEFSVD